MNIEKVKSALKTDHFSRSAYLGRITQTESVTIITEDGTPIEKEITVHLTWNSIKQLLNMVSERAGLSDGTTEDSTG